MLKIGSNDFIFSFLSFPFFCALCDYYVNFINQIEKVEFLKWSVITFARLEIFIDKFLFTQLLDIGNLNCWNLSNDFLFFFLLFLFSSLINFIKENFNYRNIKYDKFKHFDRRIKICWKNWVERSIFSMVHTFLTLKSTSCRCNVIPMPIISLEKITTITRKNKMKFHFLKILKISKSSIEETSPLLPFSSLISQIENCQRQIPYPRNRNFFLLRLSISTRKENVVGFQVLWMVC